jgi:hypothetical protein
MPSRTDPEKKDDIQGRGIDSIGQGPYGPSISSLWMIIDGGMEGFACNSAHFP